MATLTLSPSRYAEPDSWAEGALCYAFPDRRVTLLGQPFALNPVLAMPDEFGFLRLTLTPNALADEAQRFKWVVVATDENAKLLYSHGIVMPETDANLFDLVPVEQDKDACTATTLRDNSA